MDAGPQVQGYSKQQSAGRCVLDIYFFNVAHETAAFFLAGQRPSAPVAYFLHVLWMHSCVLHVQRPTDSCCSPVVVQRVGLLSGIRSAKSSPSDSTLGEELIKTGACAFLRACCLDTHTTTNSPRPRTRVPHPGAPGMHREGASDARVSGVVKSKGLAMEVVAGAGDVARPGPWYDHIPLAHVRSPVVMYTMV